MLLLIIKIVLLLAVIVILLRPQKKKGKPQNKPNVNSNTKGSEYAVNEKGMLEKIKKHSLTDH